MVKKLKYVIFALVICMMATINIYADTAKVWNGYSLYNMSNAAIEADSENRSYTVYGSRVSSVATYTIKNISSSEINAALGLPMNEVDSIIISDNNKPLKIRIKSVESVRNTYGIDGLLPQAATWYYVNVAMKPGETHTVQIKIEDILLRDATDIYNLTFLKDKNNARVLSGKNIQLKAEFSDYKPYNIVDIDGLQNSDIDNNGTINLAMKSDATAGFTIKYQPIEKLVLDRLTNSKYKKPKSIARAFRERDYAGAAAYCDEYIALPQDKALSIDQVKLVKAESLRKQNKNDEYLSIINSIDISKLYPARVKYKILIDKLAIYKSGGKEAEYNQLLTQLNNDTSAKYEFLNNWLKANGFILEADSPEAAKGNEANTKPSDSVKKPGMLSAFTARTTKFIKTVRYDFVAAVVVSFILGYFLGRRNNRKNGRRRGGSTYLFRN